MENAPVAATIARMLTAATSSGSSSSPNPSASPNAYQKPCSFPPALSMTGPSTSRRSSGLASSLDQVSGV